MKKYLNISFSTFVDYFKGQGQVAAILAILYAIGLYFTGIKGGVIVGIVTGVLSIVPYFGFIVGIVVSEIIAIVQFFDFKHPMYVVLVFALVQTLETLVITPKIVGNSVGINPIIIMILIAVSGAAVGIIGMVISVPLAAVFWKIYKEFQSGRTKKGA